MRIARGYLLWYGLLSLALFLTGQVAGQRLEQIFIGYAYGGYGAHLFDNFRVEPGPRPLDAIEDRVMSSIADAAHIKNMEVGPKLYNSIFRNQGDDGFNNYGRFYRVAERISDTEFILATKTELDYLLAGDKIGPAKLHKATKLGVKIISESDFEQMIAEGGVAVESRQEEAKPEQTQNFPVQGALF